MYAYLRMNRSILEECGLYGGRLNFIAKCFESKSSTLREELARTGFSLPKVVGIDWRLDYHVRSSAAGKASRPVFFVTLNTQVGSGELKDLDFMCTPEQMKDLLAKVKDATKQVERTIGKLE